MSNRKYLHELDYIRGWAIIGVVLVHITGMVLDTKPTGGMFTWIVVADQLARYCVPAFLFISGVLLGYSHQTKPVTWGRQKEFLARRMQQILVPYVTWTILGLWQGDALSPSYLARTLFFGKGFYYHLYFIPLIFQFYLLAPLFTWAAQRRDAISLATAIGFFMAALYQSLLLLGIRMPRFDGSFDLYLQPCLLMWVLYPLLGCVFGLQYDKWYKQLSAVSTGVIATAWLMSLVIVLFDFYHAYLMEQGISGPLVGFFRPTVQVYSLLSIALLLNYTAHRTNLARSLMSLLGRYSFGIYLVHLLILRQALSLFGQNLLTTLPGIVAIFALCISVSLVTCSFLARIPYGWVLVGQTSRAKFALSLNRTSH